jgi:hypothetical protein
LKGLGVYVFQPTSSAKHDWCFQTMKAKINQGNGFRSEIMALVFGMLLILITFGDNHLVWNIGNLDTIFGRFYWRSLDVLYPLASILVFLLYGKVKGGLRINTLTIATFLSYLIVLTLIIIDDIAVALHLSVFPTTNYWAIMEWIYPIYSCVAFFIFGKLNQSEENKSDA